VSEWTKLAVLDWTTKRFTQANIDAARLEAQVIMSHALKCERIALYTHFDQPLADDELAVIRGLIKLRLSGQPLAYVVGEQEFWGKTFAVNASVLVPRSDTETLVETVLASVTDKSSTVRVLGLCTGSGAIVVALASELAHAQFTATDISNDALNVARANAQSNGVSERIEFVSCDLWPSIPSDQDGFSIIVANPPYIESGQLASLQLEVRAEPTLALDGGVDGLDFYHRIVDRLAEFSRRAALLAVEHGFDQAGAVAQIFGAAGLQDIRLVHDLAKNPRVTVARLP
jgi:release factor glutamine methyltransferase